MQCIHIAEEKKALAGRWVTENEKRGVVGGAPYPPSPLLMSGRCLCRCQEHSSETWSGPDPGAALSLPGPQAGSERVTSAAFGCLFADLCICTMI